LRLENYLSVRPSNRSEKELFIIIPNKIKCNSGIVATNIVDVLETTITIDTDSVSEPGILGSCILGKRITMMLDLYSLFELADPENFNNKGKNSKSLQGGDYKVLLVEDTPFFRVLEKKYLESEGFQVVVACDGEEGLNILQKNSRAFDIVVADIEMPVMNGLELVKKIKSNDNLCHLPVLALTALANEEDIKNGEEAGFDAYEIKLDRERVIKRIYNLINRGKGD
jgi:two-component system chemotaxis sensor kinase CheA